MQGSWFSAVIVFGLASGFPAGAAELPESELREMEQLLAQLNFDPGVIDGEVDDRTRTAIRLYQEFAVLPVNGEPSANLLRELRQVSQVYVEMREAAPPPAAEVSADAEPDSAAEAEVAATDAPQDAVPPEAAPKAPEPPPATEAATGPAEEPVIVDAGAPEPVAKPDAVEAVEPPPEPTPEVADTPAIADAGPAEPTEPASDSDVADASARPAEPEPEPDVDEAVDEPQTEVALEATPEVTEPPAVPEAEGGFNLTGMIARLKQRDEAAASKVSAQTARAEPTVPVAKSTATVDRASYERTLIWKVQQELMRIGLDPGAADGNMRVRTRDAIETYQRTRGLPANGRVTEELFARLKVEAPPPGPAAPRPQGDAAPLGSVAPQSAGIGVAPSNGYQAFSAGYGVAQTGDYGAAVKLYDQAIDGGDLALEHLAAALYNRANAYQYLGVLDKAIEDYSAAIANKPGFPAAYYNRGFALDMKGEKVRAVEDFRRARDLGLQRLGIRSPDLPPPLL